MSKNNYVDLRLNGRLFPTWVMMNFKKFTLPDIIREEGVDPCSVKGKHGLRTYQKFLSSYLSFKSPFRDILVYHGLGSGKTVSAINIYNVLFNFSPKWNVFLMIKASLKNDPWLKDLKNWLSKENNSMRWNNIYFVHYDSPFADRDFLETVKKADSSKTSLYIFDECHNFIRNVYNNIVTKTGKRAQVIYDYIQQEKIENNLTRIVLLSATPAVNQPYELALIYNLMRPKTFPNNEAMFNQIYISSTNFQSLNEETKNMFQRRILGLTSYYIGATPDLYAEKIVTYKNLYMNKYYQEVYDHFEEIEKQIEKLQRQFSKGKVGDAPSTYSSYTRQACNFVFPNINGDINGEMRPRPKDFRVKEQDAEVIDEGKDLEKKRHLLKKKQEAKLYENALIKYINETIKYWKNIHHKDEKNKRTLKDDVKIWAEKYKFNFSKFCKEEKKKSGLYQSLWDSSPKFMMTIFNIIRTKGPVLVYSNYVAVEGIQLFKIYLNFFGFINFDDDKEINKKKIDPKKKLKKDKFRFMEYHGGIDSELREENKKIFNSPDNRYAKNIKIIMISPAGSEGINLKNVRQVHIMEPYWNEVRIEQIIGRAIRQCSHADLPMEERKVDVFRYKMIRKNGEETTDEKMEDISRRKNNLIQSFLEAVRESAVDCELFKAHNMMGMKYKCFQFEENSLFDKPVGPAFKKEIEYDKKIDNGSNSNNADTMQIKVRKIKGVKQIDENNFSESQFFWYYKENNTVYDYELNFPIGKVAVDDKNIPRKIDNETYIITNLIDIPLVKLYD